MYTFTQRGQVAQATSAGASITSLTGSSPLSPEITLYPVWYRVQLATIGKCFYQIQAFAGSANNDMLQTRSGLLANSKITISGRWPSWIGGISKPDYSQNLLEIDHPCINMEETRDLPFYYHITVGVRVPFPSVADTCPAVNGTPRERPDKSPSDSFQMM